MKRLTIFGLIFAALVLIPTPVSPQAVITSNITVLSGQQAVTATAANLGSAVIKTICVKALNGNTAAAYLGGSTVTTSTGMELEANQSWCANITNTNSVYVIAAAPSTASVSWVATK